MLGTFILAFGWFGFNAGSSLAGADGRIGIVAANTMLAGMAATVCGVLYMWLHHRQARPVDDVQQHARGPGRHHRRPARSSRRSAPSSSAPSPACWSSGASSSSTSSRSTIRSARSASTASTAPGASSPSASSRTAATARAGTASARPTTSAWPAWASPVSSTATRSSSSPSSSRWWPASAGTSSSAASPSTSSARSWAQPRLGRGRDRGPRHARDGLPGYPEFVATVAPERCPSRRRRGQGQLAASKRAY